MSQAQDIQAGAAMEKTATEEPVQTAEYQCHMISEGKATGRVLFSKDPFCFYLVDPKNGVVLDKNHCLYGQSIADTILVFPNGSGSSVVQADGMYQLKIAGTEPRAMVVRNLDTTLVASAIIMESPLVNRLPEEFYANTHDGDIVTVNATDELVTVEASGLGADGVAVGLDGAKTAETEG
ncbi:MULTISPECIES: aconitase X swivel domain-containing protein [Bifidobacterium]|nr:DUF126 domain-containing protein [Bifidobacterium tibiigranuli]MCH3975419.1 DUF126 domain-containing protein [Bifidobacterium tibiigranuli]MCH4189683.1 DUF126 domain-containing protein [Bifidobacterium tibiigranuli]MCH4204222.1 DUF126 domain-containing protein [Bifidobacterium tibiigranuli]MCH4274581.1 DUF126 domain-containing protein [Bifidobacterium tibiigranuli]MCI1210412.1 DUF126 domain-containing protein [Bifidobacterium tibiigranuli]